MNRIKSAFFFIMLLASQYAVGSDDLSYIDGSKPFLSITDINRQADAWGTCAAAYEIMAIILQSKPAQARQMKDLGNGAAVSVVMTHVSDGLTSDITPERFNSLWNYSKTLADVIPETKRTMILADAETLGDAGTEKFIEKLTATVQVCMANLEGQQTYIDSWRVLAKSGLLTGSAPNQ